jgi:hypothetical protein
MFLCGYYIDFNFLIDFLLINMSEMSSVVIDNVTYNIYKDGNKVCVEKVGNTPAAAAEREQQLKQISQDSANNPGDKAAELAAIEKELAATEEELAVDSNN